MTENAAANLIAKRLNHLLETVYPAGRGPYSLREVADAINEAAGTRLMSAAYLSQLRTGQRTEPSHSRLAAIAKFFGVDVRYFTDEETAQATDEQLSPGGHAGQRRPGRCRSRRRAVGHRTRGRQGPDRQRAAARGAR